MIKHTYRLVITLIICLITSSGSVLANELHKLDIKKSSSDASTLNVTVYTSSPYDDNVAVTKKNDNKYVILLPNVENSSSANVDYSSLKDVVSDVNVKTVNDGANGYTKITLTTTKPVSISTSARKSAPLTAEQKAYKNLIAQSRSAASKAKETTPKTDLKTSEAKKNVTVEKSPVPAANPKKESADQSENTALKTSKEPPKSVADNQKNSADKTVKTTLTEKTDKLAKQSQSYEKKDNTLKELQDEVIAGNVQENDTVEENSHSFSDVTSQPKPSIPVNSRKKNTSMPIMLFSIVACAILAMKFFKTGSQSQSTYPTNRTAPYIPEPDEVQNVPEVSHYKNWQEKYKNYVAENIGENIEYSANTTDSIINSIQEAPQPLKENTVGASKIVKKSVRNELPEIQEEELAIYEKPANNFKEERLHPIKHAKRKHKKIEIVELPPKKVRTVKNKDVKNKDIKDRDSVVKSLEKAVHNSPSTEKLPINDQEIDKIEKEFNRSKAENKAPAENFVPVKNEEEKISEAVRKSPKLKAFASKISIDKTDRTKSVNKNARGIIRATSQESAYVNLTSSVLYKNSRASAKNVLTSADLISKSKPKSAGKTSVQNKPYTTISIDEFFDTGYNSTASYETSSRVAARLARLSQQANPVYYDTVCQESELPKPKKEPLSSKKVCSAYNISKNKGFYLVDDENGNSSLIGVIDDNVTVFGQFGKIQDKTLKVIRQDEENVYILRANGERFLVEADNEKMKVLLEL